MNIPKAGVPNTVFKSSSYKIFRQVKAFICDHKFKKINVDTKRVSSSNKYNKC